MMDGGSLMIAYPAQLEAEEKKDMGAAGVALPDFGRSPTLGFVAGGEASDARGSPPSGDMSAFDIAKALIHGEMRRSGVGKAEMARRLELAEPDSAGGRSVRSSADCDARRADPFAALECLVGH